MAYIIKKNLFLISDFIDKKRVFQAIKNGFIMVIPIIITGAFALILINFPIPEYQNFISSIFGGIVKETLQNVYNCTMGLLSLIMVLTISYSYAQLNAKSLSVLCELPIVAIACYMIISGVFNDDFSIDNFSNKGLFTSIFVSIVASKLYLHIINSRYYRKPSHKVGISNVLEGAINGIVPSIVVILCFVLFNEFITEFLGYNSLQQVFSAVAINIFSNFGRNIFTAILFVFSINILWLVGIHGNNVLEAVAGNIFSQNVQENSTQYILTGIKQADILNRTFLDCFVIMGGTGTIVCLLIALLLFSKRKHFKSIGRISLVPVMFNISEIITLGIPVVLNPIFFIPFLLVPLLCLLISYFAMYVGLVPIVTNFVPWTTPVLFSGYLATDSIKGLLLQAILILFGVFIYKPFVKMNEEKYELNFKKKVLELKDELVEMQEKQMAIDFIHRNDSLGTFAKMLARDLEYDIELKKLFLLFQPQINKERKFIGAEALLRWNHQIAGFIYPPLIIEIAKEAGLLFELEKLIFDEAGKRLKEIDDKVDQNLKISVNITAASLLNDGFEDILETVTEKYSLDISNLWLEITEQDSITNLVVIEKLKRLKEKGYKLLIDDFGMGHTSISYLKSNEFDMVKLDGCITKDILENSRNSEIISSIIYLSKNLDFNVISEYVETEGQRDKLQELGCSIFQGYLYSKPIAFKELITILKHGIDNFPLRKD
jgi:lactose/cellobiose-specific phosphotransferase system IIC component